MVPEKLVATVEKHKDSTGLFGGKEMWWAIVRTKRIHLKEDEYVYPASPFLDPFNAPMDLSETSQGKEIEFEIKGDFGLMEIGKKSSIRSLSIGCIAKNLATDGGVHVSVGKVSATLQKRKVCGNIFEAYGKEEMWWYVAKLPILFKEWLLVYPAFPVLDKEGRPVDLLDSQKGEECEVEMNITLETKNLQLKKSMGKSNGKDVEVWYAIDKSIFILNKNTGYVTHPLYQTVSDVPNEDGYFRAVFPPEYDGNFFEFRLEDEKTYAKFVVNKN